MTNDAQSTGTGCNRKVKVNCVTKNMKIYFCIFIIINRNVRYRQGR